MTTIDKPLFDQFDFEEQLKNCWNITKDLKDLNEAIFENNLTTDQISNILTGIEQLYEFRFDKLYRQFEYLNHERYELLKEKDL